MHKVTTASFFALVAFALIAGGDVYGFGARTVSVGVTSQDARYEISAAELKKGLAKGDIILLDVRGDLDGEIVKGALHVPLAKLDEWANEKGPINHFANRKKASVVSYCTCPHDEARRERDNQIARHGI